MPQRNYTLEIISEVGAAKPATTPLDPYVQLTTKEFDEVSEKGNIDSLLKDPSVYKRLIRKFLYLIVTRPDISFAIQILSLFLQKPKKSHLNVALRVVKYIKGQAWMGMLNALNRPDSIECCCIGPLIICQFCILGPSLLGRSLALYIDAMANPILYSVLASP